MKPQNVVVATDLSEHCKTAARWAQSFGHKFSARVHVAHVIEVSLSSWLSSAFDALEDAEQREAAEQKVADWYSEATGAQPERVDLRAGSPLAQITELVESLEGPTLLVLAMSGRSAMSRAVLGSTAQAIANQPPCPVAFVHPDHPDLRSGHPIVAGTDLSERGNHAVQVAAEFAGALGVALDIVFAHGGPSTPLFVFQDAYAAAEHDRVSRTTIERIPGVDGKTPGIHVLPAEPAAAIIAQSETTDSDLIVLGHSGESILAQRVLGSVAHRVLKRARCSVLIVPADKS